MLSPFGALGVNSAKYPRISLKINAEVLRVVYPERRTDSSLRSE